jgi:hypothetical protein
MAVKVSSLPLANRLNGDEFIPVIQGGRSKRSRIKDINTEKIETKTSNYVLSELDGTSLCNASGGAFSVTLPDSDLFIGKIYEFKKVDSTENEVTITSAIGESIDGATGLVLSSENDSYSIRATGSGWIVTSEKTRATKAAPEYAFMHRDITPANIESEIPAQKKGKALKGYSKLIIDVDIVDPGSYVQLLPLTWNPLLNKYVPGTISGRIRETKRYIIDIQSPDDVYLVPVDVQGKVTVVVGGYNP